MLNTFSPLFISVLALTDLTFTFLQLLGYAGYLRVRVARQSSFRASALEALEKTQAMCSELGIKNQQLADAAEREVAALREEFRKEKEELEKDSSQKIADLGEQINGMLAANEELLE
ncbi:hypothetical protein, partial [Escherichia coli]|uniref:hypothetical protein n=1 Tax=Escherichia coli TaxID=562 RepID=UPI00200CED22